MSNRRIVDLNDGVAMVVTDLHGASDVYFNLRDRFLALRARGEVDRLVICGDLIHGEGPEEEDASLAMLLDVMRLQAEHGDESVLMLLGNHEMPHIYSTTLSKGDIEYTPRFEAQLARLDARTDIPYNRADVINFLKDLPFYARTQGGAMLTHAGAPWSLASAANLATLLNFDHDALIAKAERKMRAYDPVSLRKYYAEKLGEPSEELATDYLGVSGPEDPRVDDLMRGFFINTDDEAFALLWDALFSPNEMGGSLSGYELIVRGFLRLISDVSDYEQRVIVAGHIVVKNGYMEVGTQQLRMASYAHARPHDDARYLLLDCEQRVERAAQLVPCLRPVFGG